MKILVSDYDRTFEVNEENIEINKLAVKDFMEKGNIFVIATGRSYIDIKAKIDKYNILYDYLIINHGATIIDENGKIIYNFTIDNNIVFNIKNDLEVSKYNIKYLNYKPDKAKENVYFCCSKFESRLDFNCEDLTKIAITYNDSVNVSSINQKIINKYPTVNSYHISKKSIEIISSKTNKSKAIKLLANYYNLNEDNIYTIGDGYSDIDMIKDYKGYAMRESVKELKEVAIDEVNSVSELIKKIMSV